LDGEPEVEQFHRRLSDVLRRYLELRLQLPALEQTTAEFLEHMHRAPQLTTAHQELLRSFLARCDLVKFAREIPSPDECRETAAMARRFIEETASATPSSPDSFQLCKN
jgi:hypothetical protein